MINNEQEFWAVWGADNREQCERRIYKDTVHGLWVDFENPDGVQLGTIIEGCDFGVTGEFLNFPFSSQQMHEVIWDISTLATIQWHRANRECIICHNEIESEEAEELDAWGEDWSPVCGMDCAHKFYNGEENRRYFEVTPNASYSS